MILKQFSVLRNSIDLGSKTKFLDKQTSSEQNLFGNSLPISTHTTNMEAVNHQIITKGSIE